MRWSYYHSTQRKSLISIERSHSGYKMIWSPQLDFLYCLDVIFILKWSSVVFIWCWHHEWAHLRFMLTLQKSKEHLRSLHTFCKMSCDLNNIIWNHWYPEKGSGKHVSCVVSTVPADGSSKNCCVLGPGPWFNINMSSYQYRKSHCGDKTIVRSSYLHNGVSYTGKMTSVYRIRALYYLLRNVHVNMHVSQQNIQLPIGWQQGTNHSETLL